MRAIKEMVDAETDAFLDREVDAYVYGTKLKPLNHKP